MIILIQPLRVSINGTSSLMNGYERKLSILTRINDKEIWMDDVTFVLVGLAIAFGFLFGIAYLLQRRTEGGKASSDDRARMSPTEKKFLWLIRGLVFLLIVLVVCAFLFHNIVFIWIAVGALGLYFIVGNIFRFVRLLSMMKEK